MNDHSLQHYGIEGMKWGVRRYQNEDGTLTAAGKKRLDRYKASESKKVQKRYDRETKLDMNMGKYQKDKVLTERQRKLAMQTHKKNFDAEMKAIKNMSYKDMKGEKSAIGKQWVKSAAITLGSTAVSLVTPIPFSVVSWPNYSNIKTNYRAPGSVSNAELNKEFGNMRKERKQELLEEARKKYTS